MTREKFIQAIEEIVKRDAEQQAEIEKLKACAEQQSARLRAALKNIFALVIGECPSLLNEDSGGDAALCLEIENILKETP